MTLEPDLNYLKQTFDVLVTIWLMFPVTQEKTDEEDEEHYQMLVDSGIDLDDPQVPPLMIGSKYLADLITELQKIHYPDNTVFELWAGIKSNS